jgi:hypothetical protein
MCLLCLISVCKDLESKVVIVSYRLHVCCWSGMENNQQVADASSFGVLLQQLEIQGCIHPPLCVMVCIQIKFNDIY